MERLLLVGLAAFSLSCSNETVPVTLRFESAHFRYHAEADRWLCPQLAASLEHHYATLAEWLGVPPTTDKIDYHLLHDLQDVGAACGTPHGAVPSGCVTGSRLYSWQSFHAHELVHAYAVQLPGGGPPLFFHEGLAVLLGGGNGGEVDRSVPVESLVETTEYAQVMEPEFGNTYAAAGSFTRFLLDRHGREAFLAFFTGVPSAGTGEEIRAAFQAHLGESLEEALQAWRAGPDESEADFRIYLAECAAPALEAPVASFDALSCDARGGVRPLSLVASFTLAEESGLAVRLRFSRVASAALVPCMGRLQPERSLQSFSEKHLGRTRELWTDLPAGQYWLDVSADGDEGEETAEALVTVERGVPLITDFCDAAPERLIAADTSEVVFAGSFDGASDDAPVDGLPDVSARFRLEEHRIVEPTSFTPSDLEERTLCVASCPADPDADCPAQVGGVDLAPGITHTFTLAGKSGEHGYRFGLQLAPLK